MTHAEALELLPLYSLDALELDDQSQVERHVERCDRCRGELAGYATVARALSDEIEPRPGVWQGILERIEA